MTQKEEELPTDPSQVDSLFPSEGNHQPLLELLGGLGHDGCEGVFEELRAADEEADVAAAGGGTEGGLGAEVDLRIGEGECAISAAAEREM
jgi:hypothetical protein